MRCLYLILIIDDRRRRNGPHRWTDQPVDTSELLSASCGVFSIRHSTRSSHARSWRLASGRGMVVCLRRTPTQKTRPLPDRSWGLVGGGVLRSGGIIKQLKE